MRNILIVLFLTLSTGLIASDKYSSIEDLKSEKLKGALKKLLEQSHITLHYNKSKKILKKELDFVEELDEYCSIYSTDECSSSVGLNVEHVWPRSKGAKKKPALTDLHHLYMAETESNSVRSNYPFCNVAKIEWTNGQSEFGSSSISNAKCFEPADASKGNIARSMFYFAVRYKKSIGPSQEKVLRAWNQEDPIDEDERQRNLIIETYQGNTNPFIDIPNLASRIQNF